MPEQAKLKVADRIPLLQAARRDWFNHIITDDQYAELLKYLSDPANYLDY